LINILENYSIYAASNTIFLQDSRIFSMKYEIDLHAILQMNLECRFGNQSYKATVTENRFVHCNISIQNEVNLTLWYSGNQTFQISSNSIVLKRFKSNNISFNSKSKQIVNSYSYESVIVDLNSISFSNFEGRVRCSLSSSIFKSFNNQSSYTCLIYSEIGGILQMELYYSVPNAFLINETNGVFRDKISVEINYTGTLIQNSLVELTLNTKDLIERNDLKNDCSDLIITFFDTRIVRSILNCNTNSTRIRFMIQQTISNSCKDYFVYYGNENHNQMNSTIFGSVSNINLKYIDYNNTLIAISSNRLSLILIPKVEFLDVSPKLSRLESTSISLLPNISIPEYLNLVSFQVFDGVNLFDATLNSNKFTSTITSNSSRISNITVRATHKLTNETILASFPLVFYFWSFKNID
jgi:hypothetical protein